MTADEAARLDRERRDADRRYNEKLTALDRAIVSLDGRDVSRDDAARVGTALLEFLQQITGLVDTKDRLLAAENEARVEALSRVAGDFDELKVQVSVLRRAVEAIVGSPEWGAGRQPAASRAASSGPAGADDYKYVGFEDQFRGSDEAIEARLRAYVPVFAECSDVLDIGCGRGELLAALQAAGVPARGIDANDSMVTAARARGLDAVRADALAYVAALPSASLGGIVATQVVEHLEPSYLMRLLDAAARALKPGAPIVLETINPACWLAFFSSYIRDLTHVRPVHPETLQYLLRASGFERVAVRYSAPVPDHVKMKTIDLPAGVIASSDSVAAALVHLGHTLNANAAILNNLMFTHLDYAAVGYRM